METSKIVIIIAVICVILILYLHIKIYLKKTVDPSIEQAETFKTSEIVKNHKQRKNGPIFLEFDARESIIRKN